jgi:hypothetical protein
LLLSAGRVIGMHYSYRSLCAEQGAAHLPSPWTALCY